MSKIKILYISHEMSPFLEITNIAKITRELPQAMQEKGFEIRILVPRFGCINERRNRLHEVIRLSGMNIVINETDNPLIIKVASLPTARMQVYFLDNEEFFQRKFVFRDNQNKFYADNGDRSIFFCKGALETVKKLGWAPDIVHCQGWMSGLAAAYVKTIYKEDPIFRNAKVVYSAYENCFTESLGADFAHKATLDGVKPTDVEAYSGADCNAMHKGAIHYADAVVIAENVDASVVAFAKASGKPTLAAASLEDFEAYAELYEEVLAADLQLEA